MKSKRAQFQYEETLNIVAWILFFIIAGVAIYLLINNLMSK